MFGKFLQAFTTKDTEIPLTFKDGKFDIRKKSYKPVWDLKHLKRVDFKEKTLFTFNNNEQLAKWKLHCDQEFGGME